MSSDLLKTINEDISNDSDMFSENISLLRVQYLKKSNILRVVLRCIEEPNNDEKNKLKKVICKRTGCFEDIDLICYKDASNVTLEGVITEYWIDIVNRISEVIPLAKDCLLNSKRCTENNSIKISSGNNFLCALLKNKNIENYLKNLINDMFGLTTTIKLIFDVNIDEGNYLEEKKIEEIQLIKDMIENKYSTPSTQKPKSVKESGYKGNSYKNRDFEGGSKNENTLLGRNISGENTAIKDVSEISGIVILIGEVFKVEVKETKTGKKIVIFNITDLTSSITVKCFLRGKPEDEKFLEELKVGLYCKVKGEAMHDNFSNEVVLMVRDIVKMTKIERMDTAVKKRVELHLHTQMSAMDAITSTSTLIKRAAKWGHKAIAITDHGVVQAFPDGMETAKKTGIKVIYGVEAYMVDDGVAISDNCSSKTINDSFVVFDIETTGLSSSNDNIIEIGAVKIVNGIVTEYFSEFINPRRPIPFKIVELTSITDEMVKDAPEITVILPKFMEFAKGSILVAHNATFDVSFVKRFCKELNIPFDFGVLDTIPLAKFLYPELNRFKLNVVAKHLGISLINHHRAVDDASATAKILLHSFNILKEMNITDLDSLNKESLKNLNIKKLNMYHLIILVKNQVGLKNLYKLISMANLDYFFKKPRMPKSLIEQYKEGLIMGSACEAGQLFREILSGKSDEELKETIKFYDYLEIQPTGNNKFMIKNGTVKGESELQAINKRIYDLGVKNNLPVVATCDVHFIDPADEVYRRILMNGQGFSDADDQPPLYFRTTNEMLKEFSYLGEEIAKEVVIDNTIKVSEMIEAVKPIPDETFPPKIPGAEEDIRDMTLKKVHSIYGEILPEVVQKRLDKELNSIINNGYAVLYLIAQKLVAKSYEDGYLVGSRGSVGSSFVACMSGITEVNGLPPHYVCPSCKNSEFILDGSIGSGADLPDKVCSVCGTKYIKDGFDIPFETFLGFEGDKEPDIDLNFSGEYQSVVHKYTEVLFGKGHVFKAGTIGTIAEKTAFGYVKKYLSDKNMIVPGAEIERLSLGCTGIKRTSGQHPGGIMVVPSDNEIYNFTPIQHPADDNDTDVITTHFDYHSISGRLLKLDILGHDDPTVLRMLQDLTGIDPRSVPLGDDKVLSLFTKPDALGVTKEQLECEVGTYGLPEFGTKFVRQMLLDTQPKTFSDLVRISGLSHGTDVWVNNAQYYIKEGFTTLKDCISTRDDIMVYLIYQKLPPKTAFTIMEKVRKGKGLTEEDEKTMKEYDVPDWYIGSCKKIKYMFPKGHAVAYVMMAIRIAYFKVYYPKAYYATYFSVRADDFDADLVVQGEDAIKRKIIELSAMGNTISVKDKGLLTILELSFEMYKRGIKFLKVDPYKSKATKFAIEGDNIRPPISSLQGVGVNAAKSICEARKNGEFISKEDLRIRAKVSKSVIEVMATHGCLEGLQETNQLSLF